MIKFEKELEKFKPVLEVNSIEDHISNEEIKDIIDLIKMNQQVNEQGNWFMQVKCPYCNHEVEALQYCEICEKK